MEDISYKCLYIYQQSKYMRQKLKIYETKIEKNRREK